MIIFTLTDSYVTSVERTNGGVMKDSALNSC